MTFSAIKDIDPKGTAEFFTGSCNKFDQVSLFQQIGALDRVEVWRGHVDDLPAVKEAASLAYLKTQRSTS